MSRRFAAALALAVSISLGLTGCGSNGGTKDSKDSGPKQVIIGASVEPTTLDAFANNAAAIPQLELYNVYQTLVKVDGDGKLQPLLAKSYDVSPDRKTYTFHLDTAATFASGTKVTAADVVASLENTRTSKTNQVLADQMKVVSSIKAADDATVVVTLSQPSNMWLYSISSTAGMVVDQKAGVNLAEATAGSGPYKVKEWRKGQQITLDRNPHFAGTKPYYDEVVFRYFTEPTALNNALASGDIQIITNVQAPQAIAQFSDASKYTIIEGNTSAEVVLGFNHSTPALKNLKVRQAIKHAIDRKALVDTAWNGKGKLIGSMTVPTDLWYEDLSGAYPYDPAKAKELLASSGVKQPVTLRLRVPNIPYAQASGQFVASALKDAGFQVTVDTLEFPARWLDLVYAKADYDLTIIAHVEPRDIVNYANPQYYWRYNNPAFAKLIAEADAGTPEEQTAKLKQAAKMLSDDAAGDWLFMLPNLIVTSSSVTGVSENMTSLSFDVTGLMGK